MSVAPTRRIPPEVRAVLEHAIVDGLAVRLVDKLDPKLYTKVDKALQLLGGRWSQRAQAHLFDSDPTETLCAVVSGEDAPAPAHVVEGFYATPDHLADTLCRYPYANLATLPPGARVLEPSAGEGAIVHAILRTQPAAEVWAVEPNRERVDRMRATTLAPKWLIDATHRTRTAEPKTDFRGTVTMVNLPVEEAADSVTGWFDAIVMNPPFAVPGNATIWIDHLRLAWGMLRPGGRLVCVAPENLTWRQDRRHVEVRELVEAHGRWDNLPEGSFAASGTKFSTVVVTLDKPLLVDDVADEQDLTRGRGDWRPCTDNMASMFDLAEV